MFKIYDDTKNKLVWRLWVILLVEFLGTFIMVFEIIAPSSFRFGDNEIYSIIFGTYIMKAAWVSFFIYMLILLLRKISVNLNPAVTLAEVAAGNTPIKRAGLMIIVQFMGAILAGEAAFLIADAIGTWHGDGTDSLDAVAPRLVFNGELMNLMGFNATIVESWAKVAPHGKQWLFGVVPFAMETILMYGLLAAVLYGPSETSSNIRPIIIFATLTVVVAAGIPTDSIAINPARLFGAAIATQINGGEQTLQYTWIYLFGELFAVYIFFVVENIKREKSGGTEDVIKKQLKVTYSESLTIKARYNWVLEGNKPLEQMNKTELLSVSQKNGIGILKTKSRDDIEYEIIEYLIFDKDKKSEDLSNEVLEKDTISKIEKKPVTKEEKLKIKAEKKSVTKEEKLKIKKK